MNDDRYLWDRTGSPDREIERLEGLLGRFRHKPRALSAAALTAPWRIGPLLAAAAAVVAGAGILWVAHQRTGWTVERPAGGSASGTGTLAAVQRLAPGQALETDASSGARLEIGSIGRVDVGPSSRLRLLHSGWTEQRLALDSGSITARILAPPRLFFVQTPSALAVDLGCEYTLTVDAQGAGLLRVTTGWVSFERVRRESIVPAGAACATRPESGPGTPYYEDASLGFRQALERFDFQRGDEESLSAVLAAARKKDGVTLWHLLSATEGAARERVYARLAALVPPPPGVTREGALELREPTLERWRGELPGMPLRSRNASFGSLARKLWFRLSGN